VTHALAHGITLGVSQADLLAELDGWLEDAPDLTAWQRDRQRRLIGTMLENAAQWIGRERGVLTVEGAEVQVSATLPAGDSGGPSVVVAGRLDLLARDSDGRPVVVDFKSGQAKSRNDAEVNPQLATYQLAVDPEGRGTGGAKLVHLKSKLSVREQPPLTAEQRVEWTDRVRAAAVALTSSVQQARAGRHCEMCAVRICCPVQPDGRQVTV
jgi:RecB family exonuclease